MKTWSWVVIAGLCLGTGSPAMAKGKRQQDYEKKQDEATTCQGQCQKDTSDCAGVCKKMAGTMTGKCTQACNDEGKECEKQCKTSDSQ